MREKQKERQTSRKELKEALERGGNKSRRHRVSGKLADTMMRQNIDQFNQRQLRRRALEDHLKAQDIQGLEV
ncbi:MAG: hypothetical protein CM15mV53_190 [uncultured marine virus]|nr:MAG: hypothetical protein CM15mV53_190 [uncultured marine virus]